MRPLLHTRSGLALAAGHLLRGQLIVLALILHALAASDPNPPMSISAERLNELIAKGSPRVYAGEELIRIAMPVGGIVAGQLYFKGDGSLAHWDIMNGRAFGSSPLVRPAVALEQGFAVRVRDDVGQLTSFPLTLDTFPTTTFTADYPAGIVSFKGANNLPLDITLEGIAPFVPLDTAASSIPAAFLRITLKNTGSRAVEGDVLGWLQNGAAHLSGLTAGEGFRTATVRRRPGALAIEFAAVPSAASLADTGQTPPPILLANFETTDYMGWKPSGEAFGISPVSFDSLPGGGPKGRAGNACASSLPAGLAATGTLESGEFTIERNSLRFLLSGQQDAENLRVELLSGDEVLFSATPNRTDTLMPVIWDLRPHAGKNARLVVTDASSKSGLIFDQAELLDQKLAPLVQRPDFGTMALVLLNPPAGAEALPSVDGDLAEGVAPVAAASDRPFDEAQVGALIAQFRLEPGASRSFTFAVAWHFPNFELHDWGKLQGEGRWYTTQYDSVSAVVDKLAAEGPSLVDTIDLWRNTYYDSTLPRWLLDRSIANVSALATATCFRFADGRFYGFEGVYSFPGTCNHVWHYEEGAGRLFPELEMSLRTKADFVPAVGLKSDGSIAMRIDGRPGSPNPLPKQPTLFGWGYKHWASIDGQSGLLLRTYRNHLLGTDDSFVKQYWPQIRLATEWLLAQDSDSDGLPDLVTHHTLDEDIAGPSPWISSLSLAALTAVEKMARIAGDNDFADLCRARAALGRKNFIVKLWNGDRFIHHSPGSEKWRPGSYDGSHIDQVLGQQWAWRTGLGRILPVEETRAALASIFRHNFMTDVGPYYVVPQNKPSRPFAQAGMAGTLVATWPEGSYRPDGSVPDHPWTAGHHFHQGFYNETMTGFEHAFASHLIYEGMVAEGLAVARAVHDRHQPDSPKKANPFNEPEAGEHYARAMASYATLLAAGGFSYDGPAGAIAFAPRWQARDFKTAFTAAEGWGSFSQKQGGMAMTASLDLKFGQLELQTLDLVPPVGTTPTEVTASLDGKSVPVALELQSGKARLTFADSLTIAAGQSLVVTLQ
jgi:uncharacterized protein (DUF608 family)